jgi:hypothetical protein
MQIACAEITVATLFRDYRLFTDYRSSRTVEGKNMVSLWSYRSRKNSSTEKPVQ